jgi:hypothetical protein
MSIDPVADKLGKLLKMLSSPRDGEVIAAARAILRTLEGAGADIHELAHRVESGKLSEADMQRIYDAAYADGQHEMAINCRDQDDGRLTPRERDFVNDMLRWTVHRKPSEKQGKWLHLLYVRLGRRRQ